MNEQDRFMPDANRIGLLTSTVLLALALARLIPSTGFNVEVQFPGFLLTLPLNIASIMGILTAGLTASGMDWLLRGHPSLKSRVTFQWWLLPTLSTFVISIPLTTLPNNQYWWIGFIFSGIFIFFVILAEYIVVDADAPYFSLSVAGLTSISYTLFFVLAIALNASGVRLFILLPALFLASSLASLRILYLRMSGQWEFAWALGISLVCVQLAAGLHYWPLTPIQFGLLLIGPLYGLINLTINLGENIPARRATLEASIAAALCWGLAVLLR
ncbi:MAG TPA: hypothetical protein VJ972_16530 [Anaerolineales bacterium]|nr:hypothetical protein [Anaerolineales bacterium]